MHYVITNETPGKKLSVEPGSLREVSHEEMKQGLALAVARMMAPVAQRLVTYTDPQGQSATKTTMGPAPSGLRIRCYAVDEGAKQELTAANLLELYADDIKAAKAAKAARLGK